MNLRSAVCTAVILAAAGAGDTGARAFPQPLQQPTLTAEPSCERLATMPNLTITLASLKSAANNVPEHCYIQGTIAGRIRFHMQLPLAANWNGRLLNIGDGGKDGHSTSPTIGSPRATRSPTRTRDTTAAPSRARPSRITTSTRSWTSVTAPSI